MRAMHSPSDTLVGTARLPIAVYFRRRPRRHVRVLHVEGLLERCAHAAKRAHRNTRIATQSAFDFCVRSAPAPRATPTWQVVEALLVQHHGVLPGSDQPASETPSSGSQRATTPDEALDEAELPPLQRSGGVRHPSQRRNTPWVTHPSLSCPPQNAPPCARQPFTPTPPQPPRFRAAAPSRMPRGVHAHVRTSAIGEPWPGGSATPFDHRFRGPAGGQSVGVNQRCECASDKQSAQEEARLVRMARCRLQGASPNTVCSAADRTHGSSFRRRPSGRTVLHLPCGMLQGVVD